MERQEVQDEKAGLDYCMFNLCRSTLKKRSSQISRSPPPSTVSRKKVGGGGARLEPDHKFVVAPPTKLVYKSSKSHVRT